MSWMDDIRLRDMDADQRIEATCRSCGHSRLYSAADLLPLCPHRDARIAEIVGYIHCMKPQCRRTGVRLILLRMGGTGAFIGGMP